jgi:hypothetical protein
MSGNGILPEKVWAQSAATAARPIIGHTNNDQTTANAARTADHLPNVRILQLCPHITHRQAPEQRQPAHDQTGIADARPSTIGAMTHHLLQATGRWFDGQGLTVAG